MTSREPPRSSLPPSLGPGAQPLSPGESPSGLQEIIDNRSQYNIHLDNTSINLDYELKGRRRHFTLPLDNIPIQGWTRSLAWGGPSSSKVTGTMVIDLIRGSENVAGRDLTQLEAEGTAYHSSRRMVQIYSAQFAAIGAGIAMAFYGRARMKFPFKSPKPIDAYTAFPARFLPILQGKPAVAMWRITRYNLYIFLSILLVNPFARSMADTRMAVGMYRDERTHDLTMSLKDKVDRLKSNRASAAGKSVQVSESPIMDAVRDDGGFERDRQDFSDQTFTDGMDTGLLTDSAVQRQSEKTSPSSWSKAQAEPRKRTQTRQTQDSGSFFDDASPTAGNDQDMDTPVRPAKGSAWGKIRRSEATQSSPVHQGSWGASTPDFETKSDSFSFSSNESEKRLAKDQAQKDFDAMLERERREGGSEAYARDMRAAESGEETPTGGWSRRRGS